MVTIIHETGMPYEATVYATSGVCTLRGLKIAHRSPSVANNYAVFAQGANLTLEVSGARPGRTYSWLAVLRSSVSHGCMVPALQLKMRGDVFISRDAGR